MGRKGVDCGCGAREDILDRLAALRQRVEVLETEINQVESQFPDVLRDVRSAEASAVSAAESAESSREIVEGYDDRLGAVEQGVIDVNDYAEAIGDDVSAIDTEIHTTRPYMTTNTEQTITAKKHIPTATVNDDSDVSVNKAFVQATDGRNNLVHNIADEDIYGTKRLLSEPIRMAQTWATYQCRATDAQQGAIPDTTQTIGGLGFTDVNSSPLGGIVLERTPDEIRYLMYMYDVNGGWHGKIVMRMTYDGQVIE